MANAEHVKMLVTSTADEWNQWRKDHPNEIPDLMGVELNKEKSRLTHGRSENLSLSGRDLQGALFASTDFSWVNVDNADFTGADLGCAWFERAVFHDAPPRGLGDLLSKKLEYPSCNVDCRVTPRHMEHPKDCERRCSDESSHDQEHVAHLLEGVKAWNEWRDTAPAIRPDLSGLDVHALFEKEKNIDKRDVIDLKGINFNDAILRGTIFQQATLDQATCIGADLRCSEWYGFEAAAVSFRSADLRNAEISGANLSSSDFTSAETSGLKIEAVQFPGAVLKRVDLRGSSFSFSDLSSSDLSESHVCGTKFSAANLTGTDLYATRIWRSRLFDREDIDRFCDAGNVKQRTISDVASLFQALSEVPGLHHRMAETESGELSPSEEREHPNEMFYRGHASTDWDLHPTLARSPSYIRREADLMSQLASSHPEEFRDDSVFFQRLVRARHFELPCRLLDVTGDPLTALYYASEPTPHNEDGLVQIFVVAREMVYPFDSDTVSLVSNFSRLSNEQQLALLTHRLYYRTGSEMPTDTERDWRQSRYRSAMNRLVHFIAREKPYWEDRIRPTDLFKVLLVKPESSFARLRAHDGAFLISAYHYDLDPLVVNQKVPGSGKYRRVVLRVPHDDKAPIRDELKLVGVTEESLRSDLGSTAKAIADEIAGEQAPKPC